MKYTCTTTIALPIDKVAALWENEATLHEWQDGFDRIEQLSGTPNTQGATAKIYFNGKHKMELLETILVANLPHEKVARYEHIHMTNTQTTRFVVIDENTTQFYSEVEYTQFNGFMIKLFAKLLPGKFQAQSQKWMDQFKVFAEKQER